MRLMRLSLGKLNDLIHFISFRCHEQRYNSIKIESYNDGIVKPPLYYYRDKDKMKLTC